MFLYKVSKEDTKDWDNEKLNTPGIFDNIDPEEVMYWRKANAIHNFFVNEVQGGKDDGGIYFVSIDNFKELKGKLENIIKAYELKCDMQEVGEDVLPTQGGFFFGGVDYDDYYIDMAELTLELIYELLDNEETMENSRFIYNAWW